MACRPHSIFSSMSCSQSLRFSSSPGSRGCATRSRPCSRVIHPPRWRIVGASRGGRQLLLFSSGGFPVQSATGASEHVRRRSAPAYFHKVSSRSTFYPCSRPVWFPGSYGPHVFLARSGFSRYFPMPVSTGIHTGVPDGSSVVARPGHRTSHPTSTRCPSVDGTSFPRTVARTLMKRRIIALPGRSQTPRRSQTPLASGQRGDGPLCWVPFSSFLFSRVFLNKCHADT